jgi:hypothetical protein
MTLRQDLPDQETLKGYLLESWTRIRWPNACDVCPRCQEEILWVDEDVVQRPRGSMALMERKMDCLGDD